MSEYRDVVLFVASVVTAVAVYAAYRTVGIILAYIIYRRELYLWGKGERTRDEIDYREFNLLGPFATMVFFALSALVLWSNAE